MDNTTKSSLDHKSRYRGFAWGIVVLAVLLIIFLIAFYCEDEEKTPKLHEFFQMVKRKIRTRRNKTPQPLVYDQQLLNVPATCKPYKGCISKNTKCTNSWKDCGVYQTCYDGHCTFKNV